LFEQLAARSESLLQLQKELQTTIVKNREVRTGKSFRFTKSQQHILEDFSKDAEASAGQLREMISGLSDVVLLNIVLRNQTDMLRINERLYAAFRKEDRSAADKIVAFRRETLDIIRQFIASSEFNEAVSMEGKILRRPRTNESNDE
jgi:septum formation topological specificity factor MinE